MTRRCPDCGAELHPRWLHMPCWRCVCELRARAAARAQAEQAKRAAVLAALRARLDSGPLVDYNRVLGE